MWLRKHGGCDDVEGSNFALSLFDDDSETA